MKTTLVQADKRAMTKTAPDQPLRICIVFDDDVSACSAGVLIQHVAAGFPCETQSFQFDELDPPAPGVAAAHIASDADILVLALRDDRMLPEHMQSWLGLCMGLREEDQEGALVTLVAKGAETADPNSTLLEYLETVAAIAGLAFFGTRRTAPLTEAVQRRSGGSMRRFRSDRLPGPVTVL